MRRLATAHFVRRIRRGLEQAGLDARVTIAKWPDDGAATGGRFLPPKLIMVETRRLDGACTTTHHIFNEPPDRRQAGWIVARLTGATAPMDDDQNERLLEHFDRIRARDVPLLRLIAGGTIQFWMCRFVVEVRDVLERMGRHVVEWSPPQDGVRDRKNERLLQLLDQHAENSRPDGEWRGLTAGRGLAAHLSVRPDRSMAAAWIMPALEQAVDAAAAERVSGGPASSDQLRIEVDDMRLALKGSVLHLSNHDVGGDVIVLDNTVRLPMKLPLQIAKGLAGRRLGDVVEGTALDPDVTIGSADVVGRRTVLRLKAPSLTLEHLIRKVTDGSKKVSHGTNI